MINFVAVPVAIPFAFESRTRWMNLPPNDAHVQQAISTEMETKNFPFCFWNRSESNETIRLTWFSIRIPKNAIRYPERSERIAVLLTLLLEEAEEKSASDYPINLSPFRGPRVQSDFSEWLIKFRFRPPITSGKFSTQTLAISFVPATNWKCKLIASKFWLVREWDQLWSRSGARCTLNANE